ncbi:MAG TPA: YkgJ family cysteine cluster protein [Polyangiaceae bacterium]
MPNASPEPQANLGLDCRECGVCCRGRPGTVLVEARDQELWERHRRLDLVERLAPGHFSLPALPTRSDGQCLYQGTPEHPHDCSIYGLRPQACRDFTAGSAACLAARRAGRRD